MCWGGGGPLKGGMHYPCSHFPFSLSRSLRFLLLRPFPTFVIFSLSPSLFFLLPPSLPPFSSFHSLLLPCSSVYSIASLPTGPTGFNTLYCRQALWGMLSLSCHLSWQLYLLRTLVSSPFLLHQLLLLLPLFRFIFISPPSSSHPPFTCHSLIAHFLLLFFH